MSGYSGEDEKASEAEFLSDFLDSVILMGRRGGRISYIIVKASSRSESWEFCFLFLLLGPSHRNSAVYYLEI